jgi:S-formylglutathione hydrolase FrmB
MPALKRLLLILLLLVHVRPSEAARIDTLMVKSLSMNKTIPNLVLLPAGYSICKTNYPVVYLLHGAGDDYKGWLEISPELTKYCDQYNMIIVCADGGNTSWYFDSPVDKTCRYETYMYKELVTAIDIKYRTIADKKGRAVTGLSMGGHGAFYLAFRHPDIWGAAGSMSGGLDIRPFSKKWDLALRLGPITEFQDNWERNTVINLIPAIAGKDIRIIFDCGTEDFFYEVNKKAHEVMLKYKIVHDYSSRPGGHTVDYWRISVKNHLLFFKEYFNPAKSPVTKNED